MAKAKSMARKQAHGTPPQRRHASSRLMLTNASGTKAATLFETIRRVASETTRSGDRRHVYVITCYFDPDALQKFASSMRTTMKTEGGSLTGITVAVDV